MIASFVLRLAVAAGVTLGLTLPEFADAALAPAALSPAGFSTGAQGLTPLLIEVKKGGKGGKSKSAKSHRAKSAKAHNRGAKAHKGKGKGKKASAHKGKGKKMHARSYSHRPYRRWRPPRRSHDDVVAGVVLGTILAVAAAGAVPRRPSPELCWYWSNPARTRGYWDYCY